MKLLIALVVVVTAAASAPPATARPAQTNLCQTKAPNDRLCRRYGSVMHTLPSSTPQQVGRSAVVLPPGSSVAVGAGSLATLTFSRRAQCSVGVGGTATELVTWYQSSLYWQRTGRSRCTFVKPTEVVKFFCEDPAIPDCPAVMTTRGRVQAIADFKPQARSSRVVAGHAAEAIVTPLVLEFCSGGYTLTVTDDAGTASVSGSATIVTDGRRDVGHTRVVVKKVDTVVDTPDGIYESHELSIEATTVAGRGICRDRVFSDQRRWAAGT